MKIPKRLGWEKLPLLRSLSSSWRGVQHINNGKINNSFSAYNLLPYKMKTSHPESKTCGDLTTASGREDRESLWGAFALEWEF